MLTPETLVRHELVGLHVRVVESTDPTLVGCAGVVVGETMHTLSVESRAPEEHAHADERVPLGRSDGASRVRQVSKAACTFEFRLDGDDTDVEGTEPPRPQYVTVAGERLVARPARRTEQRGVTTWQ